MIGDRTDIAYTGGTPSGTTGSVVLFDSTVAFPGGCFHLLGQQWFQYSLRAASDGGTATGTVIGSYSNDRGTTWIPFYSKATADADDDDTPAWGDVTHDEIYVGIYKDIRFTYTNAVEVLTIFVPRLSLHPKKPTSKTRDGALINPDMFPVDVTGGAVTSWFRLAHPQSVITGSGYSRVHDVLDPTRPATQGTDARRPPPATSQNGLPIVTVSTAVMLFDCTSARFNTSTWGMWFWCRRALGADNIHSTTAGAGSSIERGRTNMVNLVIRQRFYDSGGTNFRQGDIGNGTVDTWNFHTIEYNSAFSADARLTMTLNGAVIAPSYSGSVLTEIPSALNAVTGTAGFFAFNSSAGFPFLGSWGPNWGFLGAAMPGVSEGLLTPAARVALMNFERPT